MGQSGVSSWNLKLKLLLIIWNVYAHFSVHIIFIMNKTKTNISIYWLLYENCLVLFTHNLKPNQRLKTVWSLKSFEISMLIHMWKVATTEIERHIFAFLCWTTPAVIFSNSRFLLLLFLTSWPAILQPDNKESTKKLRIQQIFCKKSSMTSVLKKMRKPGWVPTTVWRKKDCV